jgi:hypothetical protein
MNRTAVVQERLPGIGSGETRPDRFRQPWPRRLVGLLIGSLAQKVRAGAFYDRSALR